MPPVINYKKCKTNKVCIDVCPMQVFAFKDNKVIVEKPKDCIGCRACEVQCPTGAIKVKD